jgi:hypothetical protein
LKFPNFSLFTQIAYVFPGSSLTGNTHATHEQAGTSIGEI